MKGRRLIEGRDVVVAKSEVYERYSAVCPPAKRYTGSRPAVGVRVGDGVVNRSEAKSNLFPNLLTVLALWH